MAEIKKHLYGAMMDLDTADQFVGEGKYRMAINAAIARAENSNKGTLKNIRGNRAMTSDDFHLSGNYVTIGTAVDVEQDKLYWMFVGPTTEGIGEIDIAPKLEAPVGTEADGVLYENQSIPDEDGFEIPNPRYGQPRNLVSRILEFSTSRKIFNFRTSHFITGANVINGILYFTDGLNEPVEIDIERYRGAGNLFLENSAGVHTLQETTDAEGNTIAPSEKYTGNEPNNANVVLFSSLDPEYFINEDGLFEPFVELMPSLYEENNLAIPNTCTLIPGERFKVKKRPPIQPPVIVGLSPSDESELDENGSVIGIVDNGIKRPDSSDFINGNFVYFAYGWNRGNKESEFSPWSKPAFFPGRFDLERDPVVLASMINSYAEASVYYDPGDSEVTEVELFVTTGGTGEDLRVFSLARIDKKAEGIPNSTPYNRTLQPFRYSSDETYIVIPEQRANLSWSAVPIRAKAQEIVDDRLVYGNYQIRRPLTILHENGPQIAPDFDLTYRAIDRSPENVNAACSVKTDSEYQFGVSYIGALGRRRDVVTSEDSSTLVPFGEQGKRVVLRAEIKSAAPYWATHYRPYIKRNTNRYYNLYPKSVVKDTLNRRVYVQLDPSQRNLVDPTTLLSLKRTGTGLQTTKRLFRVASYSGVDEGFVNDPDLVQFNVPFDVAQVNTNFGFANSVSIRGTQTFTVSSTGQEFFTIDNFPAGAEGFVVRSVRINGVTSTGWTTGAESQTVRAPGRAIGDTILVDYVYQGVPENSPESDDYYIALEAVNAEDIDEFMNNEGDGSGRGDTNVILQTQQTFDALSEEIYYDMLGVPSYRVINGAHTSSEGDILLSTDRVQEIYQETDTIPEGFRVGDAKNSIIVEFPWFNCFSYTNGVEEETIRGEFNENRLSPGIQAAFLDAGDRIIEKSAHLITSGRINDDADSDRSNIFNLAQNIEKELDIRYGSIQKLHSRDTDLIVFQEDKVNNVLIGKEELQNADGTINVVASPTTLGRTVAYVGEYGISQNPESFTTYGNRIYFADRNRGAFLRLSQNGIVEVSKLGVETWTRETLRDSQLIISTHDDRNDQWQITPRDRPTQPNPDVRPFRIVIAAKGNFDPRGECNTDITSIDQRVVYVNPRIAGEINPGDTGFTEGEQREFFTSPYFWHLIVEEGVGNFGDSDYVRENNRAIQFSPLGTVTGLVDSCVDQYPPDLPRELFAITRETFSGRVDACANGIIDTAAFHSGDNAVPRQGDFLYTTRYSIAPLNITGWKLFSADNQRYFVEIVNGMFMNPRPCSDLSQGRTPILGSNPIFLEEGISPAARNSILCQRSFADELYWFEGDYSTPHLGATFYTNDINNELAGANRYYTFSNSLFARTDANSRIDLLGTCAEELCFPNPFELLTQDDTNPFLFTFNGVADDFIEFENEREPIRQNDEESVVNAVLKYSIVQGNNRFPEQGFFERNYETGTDASGNKLLDYSNIIDRGNTFVRADGGRYDPIILNPNDTILLDAPEGFDTAMQHSVIIDSLCFLGLSNREVSFPAAPDVDRPSIQIEFFDDTSALIPGDNLVEAGNELTIRATDIGGDPTGFIRSVSWDFTGATGLNLGSVNDDLFSDTITVISTTSQLYNISVQFEFVVDNVPIFIDRTVVINVHPVGTEPPSVTINNGGVDTVFVDGVIELTAVATGNGGATIASYLWSGLTGLIPTLGTSVTDSTIRLTTDIANEYQPIVTVTDSDGLTNGASTTITFEDDPTQVPDPPFDRTPAWFTDLPTQDAEGNTLTEFEDQVAFACGGANQGIQAENPVYFDATKRRRYTVGPSGDPAWDSTANPPGYYAFAFSNPLEGGGIVSSVEYINAAGFSLFDRSVDCETPYEINAGFTAEDSGLARQTACNASQVPANTVTVFADQPTGNFSSTTGGEENPVTILKVRDDNGQFDFAPTGYYAVEYTTDTSVIRFWDKVTMTLEEDPTEGCSFTRTATLTAVDNIDGNGANSSIDLNPATGQFAGHVGDTYTITATAVPDGGNSFTATPNWTTASGGSGSGTFTYTGVFGSNPIPPTETVTFTGTTVSAPSTYRATLRFTNTVANSSLSVSSTTHSVTSVGGSVYIDGLNPGEAYDITLALEPDNGYDFVPGTDYVNGSGTTSFTMSSTDLPIVNANRTTTANFSGSLAEAPDTFTASLTANTSLDNVTLSPSSDSATQNVGTTATLTVGLVADPGFQLNRINEGTRSGNTVSYSEDYTSDTTDTITFTGEDATRYTQTLHQGTTLVNACGAPTADFVAYMNASSIRNATLLLNGEDSSDTDLFSSEVWLRISSDEAVHWNGSNFTTNPITNTRFYECPPGLIYDDEGGEWSFSSSSSDDACSTSSTVSNLFVENTNMVPTGFFESGFAGADAATSGFYALGNNWYQWDGSSVTNSGQCPQVIWMGDDGGSGPPGFSFRESDFPSFPYEVTRSGTVEVIGSSTGAGASVSFTENSSINTVFPAQIQPPGSTTEVELDAELVITPAGGGSTTVLEDTAYRSTIDTSRSDFSDSGVIPAGTYSYTFTVTQTLGFGVTPTDSVGFSGTVNTTATV